MATTAKPLSKPVAGRRRAGLMADLGDLVRTLAQGLDPYRPELHYMRGPGPKWHAKHDRAPASEMPVPAMARVQAR